MLKCIQQTFNLKRFINKLLFDLFLISLVIPKTAHLFFIYILRIIFPVLTDRKINVRVF